MLGNMHLEHPNHDYGSCIPIGDDRNVNLIRYTFEFLIL